MPYPRPHTRAELDAASRVSAAAGVRRGGWEDGLDRFRAQELRIASYDTASMSRTGGPNTASNGNTSILAVSSTFRTRELSVLQYWRPNYGEYEEYSRPTCCEYWEYEQSEPRVQRVPAVQTSGILGALRVLNP